VIEQTVKVVLEAREQQVDKLLRERNQLREHEDRRDLERLEDSVRRLQAEARDQHTGNADEAPPPVERKSAKGERS